MKPLTPSSRKNAAVNPMVKAQSAPYDKNNFHGLAFPFLMLLKDCNGADIEKLDDSAGVGSADHLKLGNGG